MTTPARNVNTTNTRPGYFYQKNSCAGAETLHITGNYPWQQYVDSRPASINNVRGRSGWRNPSGWLHDHLEATVTPLGSMLTRSWCANHNQWTGSRYIDGAYATDTGMLSFLGDPPQWVRDLANTRAYLALKKQSANLSEVFAERHKTSQMVSAAAKDIAKQVRQFRGSYPRDWGNVVKNGLKSQWRNIPNRWLELQYGWKPLMSDIFGSLQVLDRLQSDTMAYHARVKGAATYSTQSKVQLALSPYWWDEYVIKTYRVKTILYYRLDSPPLAALASLGLTNPLELGWELVKYSFVVDWFLPVGNWLSTLDSDFGWTYQTGCQSSFMKLDVKSTPRAASSTFSNEYSNYTTGPKASGFRFRRTVLGSPPGVGLPHFKNPLSSLHLANALSLLTQAFRK